MLFKSIIVFCGLLALSASARADSITFQLANGTATLNVSPVERVQEAGANDTFALALNVPSTEDFFTGLYQSLCPACSGTLSGDLSATLNVSDTSDAATGTGTFVQGFQDVISGGTHDFNAQAGTPLVIDLTNGDVLTITPLATSGVPVGTTGTIVDQPISATFLLTNSVPEPASAILTFAGLLSAAFFLRRKRSSTAQERRD